MATTTLSKTGMGMVKTTKLEPGEGKRLRLTVLETARGKVPGCYAGKSFELVQDTLIEMTSGTTIEGYRGAFKNGKPLHFSRHTAYRGDGPEWFVHREGCFRGSWLYEVRVEELS